MISKETFEAIKCKYGHCASWAVWADAKTDRKKSSGVGDLAVLNPSCSLLKTLHCKAIFIGLNISRPIETPFANFHGTGLKARDFKIRYALQGTPYWGAYMTDIIKNHVNPVGGDVMAYLRRNPNLVQRNIDDFREELKVLKASNPILVAFGRDAETILRRHLDNEYSIIYLPHYSAWGSMEAYREQVAELLPPELPE